MEAIDLGRKSKNNYRRCAQYRDCQLKDCIFFEGDDHCWSLVSPFKLRRRPSRLLKDTAERCQCLAFPCVECGYYKG